MADNSCKRFEIFTSFVVKSDCSLRYRSQAEMAHTCRGTINLAGAFIDSEDSCSFVISNGGTQVFYMRANSEVERQRWVTALELAKAKAIKMLESGLFGCVSSVSLLARSDHIFLYKSWFRPSGHAINANSN